MKTDVIAYKPTDGLSYDPAEEKYWDPAGLQKEVERTFEVCHGCRMCFKYCDAFPRLFSLLDDRYDGDVRKIRPHETSGIMDLCFQCKLCEVQCPYTRRENHEFELDFPALVHRYKAQRTKDEGLPLKAKALANPDAAGRAARASFGLANAANRIGAHRWFMEKLLGVHRDKLLPDFAPATFESWAKKTNRVRGPDGSRAEAVLFQTCYVQNNEPQIGRDTVEVFEKNGVSLACTEGLRCCGMPSWERGDLDSLRAQASHNLKILEPYVADGAEVVVINPTCSMMMRREYPTLVAPEDRPAATRVAEAVRDTGEFLWALHKDGRFSNDFKSTPDGPVAYHAPCHLRAQSIGFKGRDLLRQIPGVVPATTMECCGHDGTFAMTVEGFEPSARIGKKAFDGMKDVASDVWATECPLAALQFQQHAGVKPMHPMSILARAYRENGFPKAAPAPAQPDPAPATPKGDTP